MRLLKRMITISFAALMLSSMAFAEEAYVVQKNILDSENNNSTLRVNVIHYNGNSQSVVYSGALSDFDNGAWTNMGFSNMQYALIFDWDSENEYYCITPATDTISYTDDTVIWKSNINENKITEFSNSISNVTTNMSLVYNDKYYENVLMPGQTLTVHISVTNNENLVKQLVPYIAQYDLSGKLINLKKGSDITAAANATTQGTITEDLTMNAPYTAKVFLWEKLSLKPFHSPISIQITAQDYYADDFENAETIDLNKPLCGIINTNNDTDIIKIRPKETGLYAMRLDANPNTMAQLYNSTQDLLRTTSSNDKYLFYSLTKDNDYYIQFSGIANDSYTISPANKTSATTILKNSGQTANIEANDICNVYAFTPSEDGVYIVTAVGTADIQASLYNSSYVYISSAQTADNDVSFRITNTMQAGKTYYILVSSKTDGMANNYTLYVEQPLELISVE